MLHVKISYYSDKDYIAPVTTYVKNLLITCDSTSRF